MSQLSRRRFLAATAAAAGAVSLGGVPALGTPPGKPPKPPKPGRSGDLRDIRHVMVVMQENRSFDHYFGTLRGVRGFGDRSTITLPGGLSVFQQPTTRPGLPVSTTQYPWHLSDAPASAYPATHQPPSAQVGAQGYGGTSHSWDDQHGAWQGGLMNGWVDAKGGLTTLGYLNRSDIPFHYALADAYTIGDAYHCSVLSATGPNRTYLWSGTIDAQQKHSSFTAYNGGDELGQNLLWETYAETLQKAGISWKVYQGADNYGDNALEYFKNFAQYDASQGGKAAPGNPLYDNGVATVPEPLTGISANADNLANAIRADVMAGTLPQVSWVVTNQAFSEHPDGAPNDGAYFVNGVLDALNADPDVFNSTLVVINYDENDGQFDHVPPPVAPPGTTDEYYQAYGTYDLYGAVGPVPVGLGFRVPLILISPWTRGGWVTSEVADHTSIIQFLEQWSTALGTPAISPNISDWRRRVCGDLTGAFDFDSPVFGKPDLPATTVIGDPPRGSYSPPVTTNAMPTQESGSKPARPVPSQPNANLDGFATGNGGAIKALLSFSNNAPHATKASHFAVYANSNEVQSTADYPALAPGQFTVDPVSTSDDKKVTGAVAIGIGGDAGAYDLTVIGPNRFMRRFAGNALTGDTTSQVAARYYPDEFGSKPQLAFDLINDGATAVTFTIATNHYATDPPAVYTVPAKGRARHQIDPMGDSDGWYDLLVTVSSDTTWSRRYVGHLENGGNSVTG